METLLGKGVYGVAEAARLARVHQATARSWFWGPGRQFLAHDLPDVEGRHALSFLDLIDLLVVGRLRKVGFSLQFLRRVVRRLHDDFGTAHPFSSQRLLTDGQTIFVETANRLGEHELEEVLSRQKAMPEILDPYLKQIDYAPNTKIAARWRIAAGVVVDPAKSYGKPTIAEANTTTYVLARAFWANDEDADLVADLFDVSVLAVRQAVEFEEEFHSARAA